MRERQREGDGREQEDRRDGGRWRDRRGEDSKREVKPVDDERVQAAPVVLVGMHRIRLSGRYLTQCT